MQIKLRIKIPTQRVLKNVSNANKIED